MQIDKSQLGSRYSCFECGTKFYDLNRPQALCPECGTDQADAPVRDIKALLSGKGRPAFTQPTSDAPSVSNTSVSVDDSGDDEFDDIAGGSDDEEDDS